MKFQADRVSKPDQQINFFFLHLDLNDYLLRIHIFPYLLIDYTNLNQHFIMIEMKNKLKIFFKHLIYFAFFIYIIFIYIFLISLKIINRYYN